MAGVGQEACSESRAGSETPEKRDAAPCAEDRLKEHRGTRRSLACPLIISPLAVLDDLTHPGQSLRRDRFVRPKIQYACYTAHNQRGLSRPQPLQDIPVSQGDKPPCRIKHVSANVRNKRAGKEVERAGDKSLRDAQESERPELTEERVEPQGDA